MLTFSMSLSYSGWWFSCGQLMVGFLMARSVYEQQIDDGAVLKTAITCDIICAVLALDSSVHAKRCHLKAIVRYYNSLARRPAILFLLNSFARAA